MRFKIQTAIFSLLMVLLLFFPQTAITAASDALNSWWTSVLPALLPFMLLCNMLSESGAFSSAPIKLMRFFRLPAHSGAAAIAGSVSGYPVGASVSGSMGLSKAQRLRLLALCNLAGPMFVTGTVASKLLNAPGHAPAMLASQYISALAMCSVLTAFDRCDSREPAAHQSNAHPLRLGAMLSRSLTSSWNALLCVAGSMALFSALYALTLQRLPIGALAHALLACCMEMTLGMRQLAALPLEPALQTALCTFAFTFGGGCIAAQTAALCDVSIPAYMGVKAAQGVIAATLCLLLLTSPALGFLVAVVICPNPIRFAILKLFRVLTRGGRLSSQW